MKEEETMARRSCLRLLIAALCLASCSPAPAFDGGHVPVAFLALRGGRPGPDSPRTPPPKRSRRLGGKSPEVKNASPSMLSARKRSGRGVDPVESASPVAAGKGVPGPLKVPKKAHEHMMKKLKDGKRASVQSGKKGCRMGVVLEKGAPFTVDHRPVVMESEFSSSASSDMVSDLDAFDQDLASPAAPPPKTPNSGKSATKASPGKTIAPAGGKDRQVTGKGDGDDGAHKKDGEEVWSASSFKKFEEAVQASVNEGLRPARPLLLSICAPSALSGVVSCKPDPGFYAWLAPWEGGDLI